MTVKVIGLIIGILILCFDIYIYRTIFGFFIIVSS